MKRLLAPLALAALVVGLFSFGSAASAQDDEFASIDIQLVGRVPWNERNPVNATVTVMTERAVSGTLSVLDNPTGGTTTTHEFDIDLAAGTTATFPVLLRTGWEGVQATASISSNGETVASESIQQFGEGSQDTPLVATLGLDDPPRRLPEIGSDLQLITLELDRGLRGLEGASSLIATRSALTDLGSDSVELLRVEAWIRGGGQLVVDGPTASLDDSYHRFPTANPARFRLGSGSVVYLEEWSDGIPLGGYLGSVGLRELVESQNLGYGSSGELSVLADIALPAAFVITGALLIYTFIAGPLLFGVVSVKRVQGRIWYILPALSLIFTVGILGIGFAGRRGASEAHITIVEVNERGSRATSNLLLTSNLGNDRRLETPDGWRYLGQGRTGAQRPARLRVGSSSTEISLNMPPGSNALARVSGPASEFDGDLTIGNIRIVGSAVEADVTNSGSADLDEAVAFFGNARKSIGSLSVGQTVSFSVETGDVSGRTMKELLIWPRVEQRWGENGQLAVPLDRDTITAAGSWTEWRVEQGTSVSPDGVVGVVGWTDEISSPIAGIDQGRTALFARANVPLDAAEDGFAVAARLPSRQVEPIFFENFVGYLEEYRVTLDPGYDLDHLAIRATAQSAGIGLFIDGDWQYANLPDEGEVTLSIPASAVVDGEVLLRSYITDWGWGSGVTALVIRDKSGEAENFEFDTTLQFRNVGGEFDREFEEDFAEPFFPRTTIAFGPEEIEVERRVDAPPPPIGPPTTPADTGTQTVPPPTVETTVAEGDE